MPKITLAIIAGNVEKYIARFLDSFQPLVAETILVRAIGASQPDDTRGIARDKGCVCLEYENKPDHFWPHVDDFAAARQKAFDEATGEWILWADTDDILNEGSIEAIQDAIKQHPEADGFSFSYSVPEDGLIVDKVRIVRNDKQWAWRYAVHEELYWTPTDKKPVVIEIKGAGITHMPSGSRAPNDQRNLRLLQSMQASGTMTIGHEFHYVTALRACGFIEESSEAAAKLVCKPELNMPERFEILMMLGEMCPDEAKRGQFYLQALATDPSRRESYGELAIWCCRHGRWKEMLAWTTAMMALPKPDEYLWNHRAQYYGHQGVRLLAMANRLNKNPAKGDALQLNFFKANGAKISLIHATRGRPKQALQMMNRWLSRAKNPDAIEHIVALDADDEQSLPLASNYCVVVPPGGGCVRAWNAAAAKSCGEVIVQMSDDFDCPMHWDDLILDRIGDTSRPAVLDINDGYRTDSLICSAIFTRARYLEQGYFLHPDFLSMYSDNWFSHCAHRDGIVIPAKDITFEHLHPAAGKAEMDATYKASNHSSRYLQGEMVFNKLIQSGKRF